MSVNFRKATLDNGLTIIAEVDPHAYTTAAGFWISTGARDEKPELMGVSHFLEHMMFKGSSNRSAEEVNRDFDDLGAINNAFTSAEMTAYWIHLLPEFLESGVRILADILRPSLRQEDFDSEKQVILEEIAMYEDQPFWVLYEHAMSRFYGDHPLAHRVLGTRETVGGMQRDLMNDYFQARYSSDNITLAIAGAVDFDAMVSLVEDTCGQWKPSNPIRTHPKIDLARDRSTLKLPGLNQAYLLMLSEAPPAESLDRYAAGMAAHTLGGSEGSRLYWSLVETGLAEEAQSSYDGRDGAGEFATWAVCTPDSITKVEDLIHSEIDSLSSNVEQGDVDRARARIATAAALAAEKPLGRMNRMAATWIRRKEYLSIEDEMKHIDAIEVDQVRVCAEKYPLRPKVVSIAVGEGVEIG
jgi:predicted Zn-dependent peptidase